MSVAAHPGVAMTNLGRYLENNFLYKLLYPVAQKAIQEPEQGALSQIRAAADPDVKGGEFYGPHLRFFGYPVLEKSSGASYKIEDAERLWQLSEKISGVDFLVE